MAALINAEGFWGTGEVIERVSSAQLFILDDVYVQKNSVCEVSSTTMYEKGMPRSWGVNDLRMGPVDRKMRCSTCQNSIMDCPGHFGHIELSAPVYHISYFSHIVKILRSVCCFCYRLTVPPRVYAGIETKYRTDPKLRFETLSNYLKNRKQCTHQDCKAFLPKYKQVGLTIRREWLGNARYQFGGECAEPVRKKHKKMQERPEFSDVTRQRLLEPLTPQHVRDMFDMIDGDVFRSLGFVEVHPRNFIIKYLTVPPPIIRPAIMFSESSRTRGQDDLTHKLQEILKTSKKLEQRPALFEQLQMLVATYINNECSGIKASLKRRSGVPEKSIVKRLKGKKGRLRGNLMGKRVDYSARTVISPDPTMDVDQIGVPYLVAKKLTFRERVNAINIEALTDRVRCGHGTLKGARSVIQSDGTIVLIEFCKNPQATRLQIGWYVERYLEDGDVVLFNRQPTLRKISMMAHRVKLVDGKTFRLNLSCAGSYNADFDGDEMNVHVVQDYEAKAEAIELMGVDKHIINAQNNKPALSIVQDTRVAAFLITHKDQFLDAGSMMQLAMQLRHTELSALPTPAILKPCALWTGKQAFSMTLPAISLVRNCRAMAEDRTTVIVRGELLVGQITGAMIGTSAGGIIQTACKVVGNKRCLMFMSDCQRLLNTWLEDYGFGIGVSDCMVAPDTGKSVKAAVRRYATHVDTVEALGRELHLDFYKREVTASKLLSRMLDVAGGMVLKDAKDNALLKMVDSSSKGNLINVAQILGCVGQQSIGGQRVFDKSNPDARNLSCFPKGVQSASGKGFVESSYSSGLRPAEMFFHTMSGREGLVDTSVKTADTGYLERRIVKALESFVVEQDKTVRDSVGNLVDLVYGGDGFDATHLESMDLELLRLDTDKLRSMFMPPLELEDMFRSMRACASAKLSALSPMMTSTVYLPINVRALMLQRRGPPSEALVQPARAYQMLTGWLERNVRSVFLEASVRFGLRSKLVSEWFSETEFGAFLNELTYKLQAAEVDAGEMVGALAATSVGHPCTQLTLSNFKSAGVAEKNGTLGVPRIKELIDARRNILTPVMLVFLNRPLGFNRQLVQNFAERMVYTLLGDVVTRAESLHDPDAHFTNHDSAVDQFLCQIARQTVEQLDGACSYVVRLELDRTILQRRELTIRDVRDTLRQLVGDTCILQASEPTMPTWVLRLRMVGLPRPSVESVEERMQFDAEAADAFLNFLLKIELCGVKGITATATSEHHFTELGPNGWEHQTEWCVVTNGINMRDLWNNPAVDCERTRCNDIFETWDNFGIEAASTILFNEIRTVLSFDGSYVNDRHIIMIVNGMMRSGHIMPLTRHGLNKMSTGPLVKSTFEMTADVFFEAGAFAEHNPTNSVSDNIMLGQRIPCGTGKVHLRMDPAYVDHVRHTKQSKENESNSAQVVRTYYSTLLDNLVASQPVFLPYSGSESPTYAQREESPEYTVESPPYIPNSPTYLAASPTFAQDSLWPEDSAVHRFAVTNDIGFTYERYAPSSPTFNENPYRPSTPRLDNVQAAPSRESTSCLDSLADRFSFLPKYP